MVIAHYTFIEDLFPSLGYSLTLVPNPLAPDLSLGGSSSVLLEITNKGHSSLIQLNIQEVTLTCSSRQVAVTLRRAKRNYTTQTMNAQTRLHVGYIIVARNFDDPFLFSFSFTFPFSPFTVAASLPLLSLPYTFPPAFPDITSSSFSPDNPQVGQDLDFECQVTGVPAPTVEWTKDNISLSNAANTRVFVSVVIDGVARVRITGATIEDNGEYRCIVTNLAGSDSEIFLVQNIRGECIARQATE